MISADALRTTYQRLRAAGLRPPVDLSQPREVAALVDTWAHPWRDRTDEDLEAACRAYLASDSRWWPTPGQLLRLAPPRQPPSRQLEARTPLARAEQRMGEITAAMYRADPSGVTSAALLDQAVEDTMGACGAPRCIGVGCEPCAVALADRLEELWAQRTMPETARRAS